MSRNIRWEVKAEIARRRLRIGEVADMLDLPYNRFIQILNGYVVGDEEENKAIADFMENKK